MEDEEDIKKQRGGIYNYFQGATINNLVINGNLNQSGSVSNNSGATKAETQRPKCSDEQVAKALVAINGKENVLNNYQVWLGACCLLMGKYGFPQNLESCCNRITNLPYGEAALAIECKYESVRKFSYLRFVKVDVDQWGDYKPNDDEKKLFYGCLAVVQKLDNLLRNGEEL